MMSDDQPGPEAGPVLKPLKKIYCQKNWKKFLQEGS